MMSCAIFLFSANQRAPFFAQGIQLLAAGRALSKFSGLYLVAISLSDSITPIKHFLYNFSQE